MRGRGTEPHFITRMGISSARVPCTRRLQVKIHHPKIVFPTLLFFFSLLKFEFILRLYYRYFFTFSLRDAFEQNILRYNACPPPYFPTMYRVYNTALGCYYSSIVRFRFILNLGVRCDNTRAVKIYILLPYRNFIGFSFFILSIE